MQLLITYLNNIAPRPNHI